ncbi:MAG: sulfotransferase [Chloroflexota bacterium]|nr:sulfotransferase [Chloroflexota bacterium]
MSTETNFIFIFGVSRSGTTLMRRILNRSDYIALSDENHFLGHLLPSEGVRYRFRKFGDLTDDNNVRRLVDYVYSKEFSQGSRLRGYLSYHWRWIIKKIDKKEFLQRVLQSDRSERALFVIMMQVFADYLGKPIMGEKTPEHVRYLPLLMEWFPDGKVVHMIRDPRAIFVSELRTRPQEAITTPYKQLVKFPLLLKLYLMFQITFTWLGSVTRYRKYKGRYPDRYYALRFEDLVHNPEVEIKKLCDFLGVDFQDKMVEDIVVTSKGYQLGKRGFDSEAANRWKNQIASWTEGWFLFLFRKYMRELGYVE